MRRNRRGPGYSGSTVFLARALKHTEAELVAALAAAGLPVPETATDKTIKTTLGTYVYWLNKDPRGGIWINGDAARAPKSEQPTTATDRAEVTATAEASAHSEAMIWTVAASATPSPALTPASEVTPPEPEAGAPEATAAEATTATVDRAATASEEAPLTDPGEQPASARMADAAEVAPAPVFVVEPEVQTAVRKPVRQAAGAAALTALRLLLKPNKRGSGVSAETGHLAKSVGQDLQALLTTLTELGLALPATEEHKPAFVVQAEEIYWLNKNPKDGSVWLNAKAAKSAVKKTGGTAKPRPKKPAAEA
jgi:hypothetical protein